MTKPVLVDSAGRALEPPKPPREDAPIEEKIAWLRADSAHRDAVSASANRAFDRAFRNALRRK